MRVLILLGVLLPGYSTKGDTALVTSNDWLRWQQQSLPVRLQYCGWVAACSWHHAPF